MMLATRVVSELQQYIARHGDRPVMLYTQETGEAVPVETVIVNNPDHVEIVSE